MNLQSQRGHHNAWNFNVQHSKLTAVYPGGASTDMGHTAHWIGRMRSTCTIFGNAIAGGYGLFVFIWQVFVFIVDVS